MVSFLEIALLAFTTLFPVANPLGMAGVFLSLTRQYPLAAKKILARKIAVYSFALLAVSLLLGTRVLEFFGISLAVIQIAGGLVVAATGWTLLNRRENDQAETHVAGTLEDALGHAFFPLTLPITVGPGCISIAITLGAHLRTLTGPGLVHGIPRHFLAALLGMFLLCILIAVCYGSADRLVSMLGKSGTNILTRLSAFVLFAVGVQILWNGLSLGIPQIVNTLTVR